MFNRAQRFVPTNASSIERIKKIFNLNEIKASKAALATTTRAVSPYTAANNSSKKQTTFESRVQANNSHGTVSHRTLSKPIVTQTPEPLELGIFPSLNPSSKSSSSPVKPQSTAFAAAKPKRFKNKPAKLSNSSSNDRHIRLVEAEEINNANMLLAKKIIENSRKSSQNQPNITSEPVVEPGLQEFNPIRIYMRDRSLVPPTTPQSECHTCLSCVECQREMRKLSAENHRATPPTDRSQSRADFFNIPHSSSLALISLN